MCLPHPIDPSLQLCLCHHMTSPVSLCVSVSSPLLTRTSVILDLGPNLLWYNFKYYVCKDLIPKLGYVVRWT